VGPMKAFRPTSERCPPRQALQLNREHVNEVYEACQPEHPSGAELRYAESPDGFASTEHSEDAAVLGHRALVPWRA
jgi:hypothetical protein